MNDPYSDMVEEGFIKNLKKSPELIPLTYKKINIALFLLKYIMLLKNIFYNLFDIKLLNNKIIIFINNIFIYIYNKIIIKYIRERDFKMIKYSKKITIVI